MPEAIFNDNIAKLNNIFSVLVKGDIGPGKEAEYRVAIIDIISNIEAAIVSVKSSNEDFIALLTKLRENLLSWNAQGSIFKQQIGLVDQFNELFFMAKSVKFNPIIEEKIVTEEEGREIVSNDENNSSEATRLKKELASMKSELGELKDLINSLMKEKEKQNGAIPQQPIVKEPSEEIITPITNEEPKSQLPWKREAKTEKQFPEPPVVTSDVDEELPIILPIVSEEKLKEEIQAPSVEEESISDEAAFEASATIQKLSQTKKPSTNPAQVIDQMKSIITEAEEETRKEISAFKESLDATKPPEAPIEKQSVVTEKITPPIIEAPITETIEAPIADEQETTIIPPTELDEEEDVPKEPDADPYMQLLTLEAEKYRLEKEIEKNETDFQEGLKNKQDFDENIAQINSDLARVREHIDLLRKQLIS